MSRVLVLAGGPDYAHDFAATGRALEQLASSAGHEVALVDHPDAAAEKLFDGFDALVVNALWWRMGGEPYDEWRDQWAYETPASTRDAFVGFVHGGGGLVANHTAPICFDDWPGWGDVMGGRWVWGRSSHPPYGSVAATVVADHPVVSGLPGVLELHDEVYGDLDLHTGIEVLAVARRNPGDVEQPVVWTHRYGRGRVVFDVFGHDASSIEHPQNARLLSQALAWVMEGS